MGWAAGDLKYRFQWTFPVVASRHDPDVLYVGSQHVHRSRDSGASWETISPDLTRAEPSTLEASGGPLHKDNVSTEYYATVFALAESPVDGRILWAGSDDGLIHVSRDAGSSWIDVTPPELPEWTLINCIDPSPHDVAAAWVAATRYRLDDFQPYLYRTTDYGATWTRITTGIGQQDFTRVIREDPHRAGLLYAGTETGLYVSDNGGVGWERVSFGLPVTPVHDLVLKQDDLVIATHGRSFWIVDDITPLHEAIAEDPAHLCKPRETVRFRAFHGFSLPAAEGKNSRLIGPIHVTYVAAPDGGEHFLDAGSNPPNGVIITYALRADSAAELTILDAEGAHIARLDCPTSAGVHRVVWDMRYPPPEAVAGASFWEESGAAGPLAPPGNYSVRLRVGDTTLTQPFTIVPDPRVSASAEDLAEQFGLLLAIRDRLSETHATANRIAALRADLARWSSRPDLAERIERIDRELASIDQELIERSPGLSYANPIRLNAKLAALSATVGAADAAPTRQSHAVFAEFSAHLAEQQARLRGLEAELEELDARVRAASTPIIGPLARSSSG